MCELIQPAIDVSLVASNVKTAADGAHCSMWLGRTTTQHPSDVARFGSLSTAPAVGVPWQVVGVKPGNKELPHLSIYIPLNMLERTLLIMT